MDERSHVMLKVCPIAQLTLGMLLSVVSFAEEATPAIPVNKWLLDTTLYLDDEPAVSDYSTLLERRYPI